MMVKNPEDYPYSSAKSHITGEANILLKEQLFDEREMSEYKLLMKSKEREEELEEIRTKTRLGKPHGGDDFIVELSRKLGRSLIFRPKGRPIKKKD